MARGKLPFKVLRNVLKTTIFPQSIASEYMLYNLEKSIVVSFPVGVYVSCWWHKGIEIPVLSYGRYLTGGQPIEVSAYIISSLSDSFKKGKSMNLLDDLYFYLWDKFLRISLKICGWIDDALGFEVKDPDGEGGENGD